MDLVAVSSLATAGATLVVAVATFASVRSSIRVARNAERALLVGMRPVLFPARRGSARQTVRWGDEHFAAVGGGEALIEEKDGVIYLAMTVRNVGSGIAVLHGWALQPNVVVLDIDRAMQQRRAAIVRPEPSAFREQSVDIYVSPGDDNCWFAAIRRPDDPDRDMVHAALAGPTHLWVDLMYGDQEGGQRTISRFGVSRDPSDPSTLMVAVVRHWFLDRNDPR